MADTHDYNTNDVEVSARSVEYKGGSDAWVTGNQYRKDGTPGTRRRTILVDTAKFPPTLLAAMLDEATT